MSIPRVAGTHTPQCACAVRLGQGRQRRDAILRLQFPANIAASRSGEEARKENIYIYRAVLLFSFQFWIPRTLPSRRLKKKEKGKKRVIRFFCIRFGSSSD
ncbi:hypothetical protein PDJAM_G00049500 [Pangasius djambal]|uniref:Uncharacterized protein n=1 Tax=Pangasius djambal TaxID=1691987 RepID=A0ACC5YV61_9TELE|nr:hypothetical protein [Pangasius djambal]